MNAPEQPRRGEDEGEREDGGERLDRHGEERRQRVSGAVEERARRMRRGREDKTRGLMFGLGFMGLIGWSVALPALGGVALGLWIDRAAPGRFSWTLMLLAAGAALGAANAWMWTQRFGRREQEDERPEDDD